jgi:hypothetical protein
LGFFLLYDYLSYLAYLSSNYLLVIIRINFIKKYLIPHY